MAQIIAKKTTSETIAERLVSLRILFKDRTADQTAEEIKFYTDAGVLGKKAGDALVKEKYLAEEQAVTDGVLTAVAGTFPDATASYDRTAKIVVMNLEG